MKTNTFSKKITGGGVRVAIVRARFNARVTNGLLRGCLEALTSARVPRKHIRVFAVPGSFEIPFVAARAARSGHYDVIITLGAIIKGETKHDEYIANAVSHALMSISIETGVPVIFGVITPNNLEQALARARGKETNKGWEAAMAAIEMAQVTAQLASSN